MIALRTFGTDSNPAGAALFVGIPVPVGVRDGDLVLVALLIPATGITITAPDGWTKIAQTDHAVSPGIATYWRTALNEQARWVFSLSSSAQAIGIAMVYAGADPYQPIEAHAERLTAASTSHGVASVATALDAEEVVLFVGATAAGTYTPAGGFLQSAAKSQTAAAISAQHRQQVAAGNAAAFNETFSASAGAASSVIMLRASVGTLSIDDVRGRLLDSLPQGADRVYDLEPGGDYYALLNAIAAFVKYIGFDLVDLARSESRVARSRFKLPDWEHVFGLDASKTALGGTIPQRQRQLTQAWRVAASAGASSRDEIRNVVGPILGYVDATQLQILETQRAALTTMHNYTQVETPSIAIPATGFGSASVTYVVKDGGRVSAAGVRLQVFLAHTIPAQLTLSLKGPDGTTFTWPVASLGVAALTIFDEGRIYSTAFAAKAIAGVWTLTISSSGLAGTLDRAFLFVEGIGRDVGGFDALGAAIFEWGAFADPTLINGGGGGNVDFDGALRAVQTFAQAHTIGTVIRGSTTVSPGQPLAIPDDPNCIPNEVIPS